MGYSCSRVAGLVLEQVSKNYSVDGSQNVFSNGKDKFFFETSRREHVDGAITGSVYMMLPDGMAIKKGSFRINGDGTVSSFYGLTKEQKKKIQTEGMAHDKKLGSILR
jgi:hypothetical protein